MIDHNKVIASPSSPCINTKSKTTTAITTEDKIKAILNKINHWKEIHRTSIEKQNLPFVSVTYAQSLDGMIAIKSKSIHDDINDENQHDDYNKDMIHMGDNENDKNILIRNNQVTVSSNLQLSCQESFQLTHALRSIHDGILIGGNTLLHDNPRLNNRLWKEDRNDEEDGGSLLLRQPIPIILDTNLKYLLQMMNSNTKIQSMSSHEKIIICCSECAYNNYFEEIKSRYKDNNIQLLKCKLKLDAKGGGSKMDCGDGHLNLYSVLENLRSIHGIKSVMVEGGSSVLSCFMTNAEHVVDCVCVTIVPKMIGGRMGLSSLQGCNLVEQKKCQLKGLEFDSDDTTWSTIGTDCIFLASCRRYNNKINNLKKT